MSDWVVAAGILGMVVVFLYLAERRADHDSASAKPSTDPPPQKDAKDAKAAATPEKKDAPAATTATAQGPDSVKSMTVEAGTPAKKKAANEIAPLPKLEYEEDVDVDPTKVGATTTKPQTLQPPTKRIVYDEDAAVDEPTRPGDLILLSATAQTDKGARRKRNEDSVLVRMDDGLFVVADGMGGYNGGEIASALAVSTIEDAFKKSHFAGEPHTTIPSRASDLARAIQMANEAIQERGKGDKKLEGMGTTLCAARFSPNKQRLYVAHVGDSRLYRLRDGHLRQMTSDHTMKDFGVTGAGSEHLSRAVGIWPTVPIDILLAKPIAGDSYLLCSDGLTKMVSDAEIAKILAADGTPEEKVAQLVNVANANGGKDNITTVLVQVYGTGVAEKRAG
jgi:PPM family protein phosphatase